MRLCVQLVGSASDAGKAHFSFASGAYSFCRAAAGLAVRPLQPCESLRDGRAKPLGKWTESEEVPKAR